MDNSTSAQICEICGATVLPQGVRTQRGHLFSQGAAVARWCQYARQPHRHPGKRCVNPCPDTQMDPTETLEYRAMLVNRQTQQALERMAAEFKI